MTVGETLTEARNQAGLSVEDLSARTQIRDTVIRSIEQDDYAACGGDLYVRGYVRALAGAVGLDAQPLIREYDRDHFGAPDDTRFDLPPVTDDPAATRYDLPPVPAFDEPPGPGAASGPPPRPDDATRFDIPPVAGGPVAGQPVTAAWVTTGPATEAWLAGGPAAAGPPAAAGSPAGALSAGPAPGAPAPTAPPRRRVLLAAAAALVVLAGGTALGISLTSGGGGTAAVSPSPGPATRPAGAGTGAAAGARADSSAGGAASPGGAASAGGAGSPSAAGHPSASAGGGEKAAAGVTLPVAAAEAYGPDGTGDGDHPEQAGNVLAGHPSAPWSTEWYATARFGMLKHGTGLLLSLGGKATVSGVRLELGRHPGAAVQLRVGNSASPSDLRLAAARTGASGTVQLNLKHPVRTRYLLIWFVKLPPDGQGHYAETVAHVTVTGTR